LECIDLSRPIRERLAAADRSNIQWQRDLSVSYDKVDDVLAKQDKLDEALKAYRDGIAIADRLAATDRSNTQWQRDLAISHSKLPSVYERQGRTADALQELTKARDIISALVATAPLLLPAMRNGKAIWHGSSVRSPVCKAKHTRNSCTHCQGSQLNSSACLLLAQSAHAQRPDESPLFGDEQKCPGSCGPSGRSPKALRLPATCHAIQKNVQRTENAWTARWHEPTAGRAVGRFPF
jgi:hypothetical protein